MADHCVGTMIVTGSGRGIGASVARISGARGYAVVVNYARDECAALRVASEICGSGGRAIAIQGDVSREDDVHRLFDTADREFGPLKVLVNNAGITGGFSRVDEVSAETLSRVFAVNVIGSFLCAREAVRRLSTRHGGQGGSIINISSRAALIGGGGEWVHYAATKGALDTFTLGLSREVGLEGIRVNSVAPGLIDTEMHASAGASDRTRRLAQSIPMGRAGTADEVAEAVVWLASDAALYVTGANVAVSGGR